MGSNVEHDFDNSRDRAADRVDPRRYPSRLTFLEQSELQRAMQQR